MSSLKTISVRPLVDSDEAVWRGLWQGYLTFYKHALTEEVNQTTWRRLMSDDPTFVGLAGLEDEELVGIAHYILHPSTWSTGYYCYLEDLFVDHGVRGRGVGQSLIKEIYRRADSARWDRVYWMTQETNYKGRVLYDKLAHRTEFIVYERQEGSNK